MTLPIIALSPHITQLRHHLLDTLADLRNRDAPMEPDRARAVAQVASVLVDTAKVEIEYLKVTDKQYSEFLDAPEVAQQQPGLGGAAGSGYTQGTIARLPGVTKHRLKG